jgi:hypothetical protein
MIIAITLKIASNGFFVLLCCHCIAVDEVQGGFADTVTVQVDLATHTVIVTDNGRYAIMTSILLGDGYIMTSILQDPPEWNQLLLVCHISCHDTAVFQWSESS